MRFLYLLSCAFLMLVSTSSWAQGQRLSTEQVDRIVERLNGNIQELYVFPDKRAQIVQAIRADQAEGRFADLTAAELAQRLTEALFAVSGDKHLNVAFDPARSRALDENPDPMDSGFFDAEGLRLNQGYVRQEILPGNIRYVRIQMFFWTEKVTAPIIDAAAQFLSGGSAVIIDLRGNGGGHVDAVQRLISYLMPGKSVPLMTFFDGRTGKSTVTKSTAKLPSDRIAGRPVYVLIDRGSFSAAEEFAYHVQQFKLGTLVGEQTQGGANNNMFVSLPEGFIASVSFGRPVHAISETNWEGTGIAPDQAAPGPAALDVALADVMAKLAQSDDPKTRAEAEWELPAIHARLRPVRVSPDELRALIGSYGEREIRMEGERLISQRAGMPPLELAPLGEDVFAVVGINDVRIGFVRSADKVVLEVRYRDGRKIVAERQ